MQITLTQSDMERMFQAYIENQGIVTQGKKISVTYTTKRKGPSAGITAVVNIDAIQKEEPSTFTELAVQVINEPVIKPVKPTLAAVVETPIVPEEQDVIQEEVDVFEPEEVPELPKKANKFNLFGT